mmetsp:Transcript_2678/g.6647  ORF Transcript_2678/g.6647 Transcript_2678/m.6647 type:complete len:304 (-) Transcript_2678:635-1546(-)
MQMLRTAPHACSATAALDAPCARSTPCSSASSPVRPASALLAPSTHTFHTAAHASSATAALEAPCARSTPCSCGSVPRERASACASSRAHRLRMAPHAAAASAASEAPCARSAAVSPASSLRAASDSSLSAALPAVAAATTPHAACRARTVRDSLRSSTPSASRRLDNSRGQLSATCSSPPPPTAIVCADVLLVAAVVADGTAALALRSPPGSSGRFSSKNTMSISAKPACRSTQGVTSARCSAERTPWRCSDLTMELGTLQTPRKKASASALIMTVSSAAGEDGVAGRESGRSMRLSDVPLR